MTLLILAYNRGIAGSAGNAPEMLDAHFATLACNFENVLPGDSLVATRPSVCLCFDGGFYDFYANVLPLLKKHKLRAMLAVAPAFIRERVEEGPAERLALDTRQAYAERRSAAFCTWPELEEIVSTGAVAIAAHGYTHRALNDPDADLEAEVHVPRTLLTTRLHTTVESFVLPFGQYNGKALDAAKNGYDYVFGDGGAVNSSWHQRLLYRIDANNLSAPDAPFSTGQLLKYRTRRFWQRLVAAA